MEKGIFETFLNKQKEEEREFLQEKITEFLKTTATMRTERVSSTNDAILFFREKLKGFSEERVIVAGFDADNRLIAARQIETGSPNRCTFDLRKVVKFLLKINATSAILAHNHPSEGIDPSPEDKEVTKTAKEVLSHIEIVLNDHIIITRSGAGLSMRESTNVFA